MEFSIFTSLLNQPSLCVEDVAPVHTLGRQNPLRVSGGSRIGNLVFFHGPLAGGTPPQISVADGTSPFGYFPLSGLGVPKQAGFGDETIVNFTLTAPSTYLYAGATHNVFGVTSNGYVIVGGGTAADVQFNNQNLPDPTAPNNTLAAFWTDLNPGVAAAADGIRVALLNSGPLRWAVVDFQNVPNFTSASGVNSFPNLDRIEWSRGHTPIHMEAQLPEKAMLSLLAQRTCLATVVRIITSTAQVRFPLQQLRSL